MEILMKVKCSSSPNPNTIKVVDHHHQLQQQHKPTKNAQANVSQHFHGKHANNFRAPTPRESAILTAPAPCLDCTPETNAAMDCCALAAQKQVATCQLPNAPMDCSSYCGYASCCSGGIDYACCGGGNGYGTTLIQTPTTQTNATATFPTDASFQQQTYANFEAQSSYEYQEPEENFVSIDDEKIKAFLQKIGEEQKLKTTAATATSAAAKTTTTATVTQIVKSQTPTQKQQAHTEVFEIIELDVARDVEKLQRLRESAEKRVKKPGYKEIGITTANAAAASAQFFAKTSTKINQRKSPNISLVPTTVEQYEKENAKLLKKNSNSKENIIARIDLVDSDSEVSEYADGENGFAGFDDSKNVGDHNFANIDDDDDDGTASSKSLNPLLAAAAVSCELGCDNDDNDDDGGGGQSALDAKSNYGKGLRDGDEVYVAASDDEEQLQFIDEREEGPELRWHDFEEHSSSNSRERQIFECHICAKTVQSNYNLRRHMMIHTGERPFGCDLCDRRFREISDLKKHRRRHANQANFFCMICRINPPLETDSTRCGTCDTKNGTLIAAVRPDKAKPPAEYEHIYGLTARSAERRKSSINQISVTEIVANNEDSKNNKFENSTPNTSASTSTPKPTALPAAIVEDSKTSSAQTMPATATNEAKTAAAMRALARKRGTYKCPLCKRVFGTRHNLKRHFMIHTGEKPYSCPHCRKPFRELSTLKKHMVTHRRDRWYKCLHCPQKYRDYLDYMEHRHVHSGEDPRAVSDFDSDDGGNDEGGKLLKKFAKHDDGAYNSNDSNECDDDNTMDYDVDDDDSLECCECGQRFCTIEQFTEHVQEHELNRVLYECYICQQLFDAQKDLVDHMNEEHQTET